MKATVIIPTGYFQLKRQHVIKYGDFLLILEKDKLSWVPVHIGIIGFTNQYAIVIRKGKHTPRLIKKK